MPLVAETSQDAWPEHAALTMPTDEAAWQSWSEVAECGQTSGPCLRP